MKHYFITATDTDAGKTFIACALINALVKLNYKVATYKPVSAGCIEVNGELINEDAQALANYANCNQTLNEINPLRFKESIAPHIAANKINKILDLTEIVNAYAQVSKTQAHYVVTEGAGGWRLPLNTSNTVEKITYLSDFVKTIHHDVILVVNMRLGCLNHAVLTYEAIKADGINCIAWVANSTCNNSMPYITENIEELKQVLSIPLIGDIRYYHDDFMSLSDKIHHASNQIDLSPLL